LQASDKKRENGFRAVFMSSSFIKSHHITFFFITASHAIVARGKQAANSHQPVAAVVMSQELIDGSTNVIGSDQQ
jgi:hypothetical protein